MISMLVTASAEDGQTLTDEEIHTFLRMLFPLGADTTHARPGQHVVRATQPSLATRPSALRSRKVCAIGGVGRTALGARGRNAPPSMPEGDHLAWDRDPGTDQ